MDETTHDIGPFFWHVINIRKGTPFIHRAQTAEVDEPFRISRSFVLRIPGKRGLVLGRWKSSGIVDEAEALANAVRPPDLRGRWKDTLVEWDVTTTDDGDLVLAR